MEMTIRRATGVKADKDGTVVSLRVETIDGTQAHLNILPEAIYQVVATMLNGWTEATVKASGGLMPEPERGQLTTHDVLMADQILVVDEGNPATRFVQILTQGGALLQVVVPTEKIQSAVRR